MKEIQFDYFRGIEAEQYSFYRIPKVLFTTEYFNALSCEAKVLYGLMLDRMGLSMKNQWFDEENRAYIIFTVEEIMELLCCKTQKAVKLIKELDTENGIGLIEKKRQGQGRPNIIYVKNFLIKNNEGSSDTAIKAAMIPRPEESDKGESIRIIQGQEGTGEAAIHKGKAAITDVGETGQSDGSCLPVQQNSRISKIKIQEKQKEESQSYENKESGFLTAEIQSKPDIKNCENQNSRIAKIENQEFWKSKSNNTDINKTDYSDTDPIYPILSRPPASGMGTEPKRQDTIEIYRNIIRNNISYPCFQTGYIGQTEEVDELVELMAEVMAMPDQGVLRIAGVEKPVSAVKGRFMKINQLHMEYVLDCLSGNTTKIGNIKAYLLTVLYNATLTINHYYTAEVRHDMCGSG